MLVETSPTRVIQSNVGDETERHTFHECSDDIVRNALEEFKRDVVLLRTSRPYSIRFVIIASSTNDRDRKKILHELLQCHCRVSHITLQGVRDDEAALMMLRQLFDAIEDEEDRDFADIRVRDLQLKEVSRGPIGRTVTYLHFTLERSWSS